MAQKEDQEERIATLEKRYLNSQREATQLHDLNERVEQDMKNKEEQICLYQEKIKAINEKLDISEQKLIEYASMPDIEEQLKDRMEALAAAQERQGTAEEHCTMVSHTSSHLSLLSIFQLENTVEEKNCELSRLSQRLKMNEEHNTRLSATVDKLLTESNERLQVHLKERMHALEEKNQLSNEVQRMRKSLEDIGNQKVNPSPRLVSSLAASVQPTMLRRAIHADISSQSIYLQARNLEEIAALRIEVKQLRNSQPQNDEPR